jgi:hypothetical protein
MAHVFQTRRRVIVVWVLVLLFSIVSIFYVSVSKSQLGTVAILIFGWIALIFSVLNILISLLGKIIVHEDFLIITSGFTYFRMNFKDILGVHSDKETGFRFYILSSNNKKVHFTPNLYNNSNKIVPLIEQKIAESR